MEDFKNTIIEYLKDKQVIVSKVEQEGENKSIICHISKADNDKIKSLQKEMEQKFDVIIALSEMYGMNVVIIEANDMEE